MEEMTLQVNIDKTLNVLKNWLTAQAPKDAISWLNDKEKQILTAQSPAIFYMTFSAIPTHFPKEMLTLNNAQLKETETIRNRWRPFRWSVDQVARTHLLLFVAQHKPDEFKQMLDKIFSAADLYELIALYQALPLFPHPEQFTLHATNGIRSNMLSVFDAIALSNPYPADFFNDTAWNQVVLKTLFVESEIERVIGIKRRVNATLAEALANTARERSSAHREIKLELWHILGIATGKDTWPVLKKLTEEKDPVLHRGGLLACYFCPVPEAKELLKKYNDDMKNLQEDINKLEHFSKQLVD